MKPAFPLVALALASLAGTTVRTEAPFSTQLLPDVLKKTIAYYGTLSSYADTGTLKVETTGTLEEARFATYFRRPTRDLFFDFQALSSTTLSTKFKTDLSAYRTVLWMFKGEMQKYSRYAQTHEMVNPDNQANALRGTQSGTYGASIMIPSLLYTQARLPSAILQIEEAELAGVEEIAKRRCHKVTGTAAAYYPSGQRTSVRPVTVWIDAETQLIRRVLEDTPKGYGKIGDVMRYTFDFQPQANPAIDDAKFQFTVPTK